MYIYGSFIRFYLDDDSTAFWGFVHSSIKTGFTFMILILLSITSFIILYNFTLKVYLAVRFYPRHIHWFLGDSNKFFALATGVFGFLFFKSLQIPYNKIINKIASGTFGVLCIHANSDAMRSWLWGKMLATPEIYSFTFSKIVLYSVLVVLGVFFVCNLLDIIRIATVEKLFLKFWDKVIEPRLKNK